MAQFNIDAHLSNGKRLQWLAIPDEGESLQDVVQQMKTAATRKFGLVAPLRRWTIIRASNGVVTVTMHM
ncbi:hypothetical protein N5J43_16825 [Pseudomonas nicosulfuronedens]|uniref:hypothetical protein n=1 Tax=Pseudomonas nicosulfuronedens TaxID=2571105 RepID=UPI00244CA3BD|nr:hypothetical protein [Pseudomonas nicosulfuronedens]MDH1012016.1 hypothetical protein [Pseudomonas nicosulfuronedens]MDH1980616.1 hypothetical protein [Pseudomonas nicosulfuronedens]MDH2027566.1 hypothetical protein [Pseudomonas nicosulfuronedens]